MRNILIITLISFLCVACAKENIGSKNSFKLNLGHLNDITMSGGAYVQTEDLITGTKNIIPLDSDNTATIPNGTYNFIFVTFSGPSLHLGTRYCGYIDNMILPLASSVVIVNINQKICSEKRFIDLAKKILGTNNFWDSAVFNSSKWGQ